VSVRNALVSKNEGVKAAWSQVDIVLQRRADLIPNLVETVKGLRAAGGNGVRRYREGALGPAFRGLAAREDSGQRSARWSAGAPAADCRELSSVEIQREFPSPAG